MKFNDRCEVDCCGSCDRHGCDYAISDKPTSEEAEE